MTYHWLLRFLIQYYLLGHREWTLFRREKRVRRVLSSVPAGNAGFKIPLLFRCIFLGLLGREACQPYGPRINVRTQYSCTFLISICLLMFQSTAHVEPSSLVKSSRCDYTNMMHGLMFSTVLLCNTRLFPHWSYCCDQYYIVPLDQTIWWWGKRVWCCQYGPLSI